MLLSDVVKDSYFSYVMIQYYTIDTNDLSLSLNSFYIIYITYPRLLLSLFLSVY